MIPRPFERPEPEKTPDPTPIETITVEATILDVHFPSDTAQFTLFEGDTFTPGAVCNLIEYAENAALGRFAEKFMVYTAQVLYMAERRVKIEIPAPKFTP